MNNSIKVSVIVPVYNTEKYLRQCVDSILAQTLKDIEIILVDDGSTDNSPSICDEYAAKDERVHVIHQKNGGLGVAYNSGTQAAKGEYIGYVESDDWIDPKMYEELYAQSDQGRIDIVKSLYRSLEENGTLKEQNHFPQSQWNKTHLRGECSGFIQGHVSTWSGIYRSNFLKKNNIRYNETPGAHSQDFGYALRCYAYAESIYVLSRSFLTYRLFSGNHNPKYLDSNILDELEITLNDLMTDKSIPQKVWETIYKRTAPRLSACQKTADEKQMQRIFSLLFSVTSLLPYQFFEKKKLEFLISNLSNTSHTQKKINRDAPNITKNDKENRFIMNFLYKKWYDNGLTKRRFLLGLFSSEKKPGYSKIHILGIPVFIKNRKSINYHYTKIGGLSISKKIYTPERWHIHYMLFRTVKHIKKPNTNKWYIFGIPFVTKKHVNNIKKISLFGIPVYRKHCFNLASSVNKQNSQLKEIIAHLANLKCIIEAQSLHPTTFAPYKNAFVGKEVVLVCTGPSARSYTKIPNAIHVGVNGAIYMENVSLDYLFVQDFTSKQECNSSLNIDASNYIGNNCKKFYGIIPDTRLSHIKDFIGRIPMQYSYDENTSQYILEDLFKHNVAYDISREPLGDFGGTVYSALQFILYANPKKLYLVGWDCGAGYAYNKPNALTPAFAHVDVVKQHIVPHIQAYHSNMEIVSINPVGLRGVFKDVYTKSYLAEHPEIKVSAEQILEED